jgi:hypothetical protein
MSHVIEMDKQNLINRNLDRPPLKDTVTVPVGGNKLNWLQIYIQIIK